MFCASQEEFEPSNPIGKHGLRLLLHPPRQHVGGTISKIGRQLRHQME
jgi:hypothetical protein